LSPGSRTTMTNPAPSSIVADTLRMEQRSVSSRPDIVFVGNFVKDVIITHSKDGQTTKAQKMGGSVTYGPLAASAFGFSPRIICNVGEDIPTAFLDTLINENRIDLSGVNHVRGCNTSYLLEYDQRGHRTLRLKEKGSPINLDLVLRFIGRPDAVFFVPIAGEFDEDLVIYIAKKFENDKIHDNKPMPIIATDIQGAPKHFCVF
jgi:sugar/nucleoside kinase (ribokinase family)